MGTASVAALEQIMGVTLAEAHEIFCGWGAETGVLYPIRTRVRKSPPRSTPVGSRRAGELHAFQGIPRKRMKGLEPSTFCMASRRSSQLSYIRASSAV
jgi:hypothetical protein